MAKNDKDTLFRGLVRLFRSGPLVKRRVKMAQDSKAPYASSALDLFKKSQSHVFNNAMNSYGAYDRMCVLLGTRIPVPGKERFKTLQQLIDEHSDGEKFLVYAYDHAQKRIVPAWAHHPRSSGIRDTVKVTFDDGSSLVCTPDHPCMLRDGTYRDAGELKPSDSMMPFYRKCFNGTSKKDGKKFDGYASVYTMGDDTWRGWEAEHRMVAEWHGGRKVLKDIEHVHHIDRDPSNNDPDNLEIVDAIEHMKMHAAEAARLSQSPEFRAAVSAGQKRAWDEDDGSRHAALVEFNRRPDMREHHRRLFTTNNPMQDPVKRQKAATSRSKTAQAKREAFFAVSQDVIVSELLVDASLSGFCSRWKVNPSIAQNWLRRRGLAVTTTGMVIEVGRSNNHKVVSVEPFGSHEVGDISVDGYENFATQSILVHNSRYADFSEMLYTAEISSALDIYCLAGDNRVLLLDGSTPTVEDLYARHAADFRVYSYDPKTQKLRHCVCSGVTKTGTDQPICRVTLEDDCVMRLTSRHLVMAADGTYKRVEELKAGDGIVCADRRSVGLPACTHGWVPEERHHCEECEQADREAGRHLEQVREHVAAVKSVSVDGFDDVYDLHVAGLHNFAAGISQSGGLFAVVHNSDETVAQDDRGRSLHIYSNNPKIRELLGELFYETLNVEFNLRPWVRSMLQYGDMFCFLDVSPEHGVINVFPIPVNEIEREEGYDPEDPLAVRFRWVTQGNTVLENWQVAHFRNLNNDAFLPYGTSVLESARRIWRQLILIEDAMLVYRIVRSPERRIFYIDVGNIPPDDVPAYLEKAKSTLRSNQIVDKTTGRVDLRYNPLPLSHSTLVPLLDGRTLTLREMAAEHDAGKENWVYSVKDGTNAICPGKVVWCGKNYTADRLVRVWFDHDRWIDAAPEHPFVMRDGTKKRADELVVGEKLMPLYVKTSSTKDGSGDLLDGYEKTYDPASGTYVYTHRFVAAETCLDKGSVTVGRSIVHHVDFDKRNNDPRNLREMEWHSHIALHAANIDKTANTPERLEERRRQRIRYNKSPEKRAKTSRQNIERDSVAAMEWYNGSELHASHNEARRIGRGAAWKDAPKREKAQQNMRVKFDATCARLLGDVIARQSKFIGLSKMSEVLKSDVAFVEHFKAINEGSRRDVMKAFNKTWLRNTLEREGLDYLRLFEEHNQSACVGGSYVKAQKLKPQKGVYKNHEVVKVEQIDGPCDVFCMTVHGPDGEHDRHNVGVCGDASQFIDRMSFETQGAVIVGQSVDEDYFIPIRGGETGTRIDTLPGGTHVSAIDDVSYIQSKLFAALKVPKAYLGYDDALCLQKGSLIPLVDGRTLSIEDLTTEFKTKPIGSSGLQVFAYDIEAGRVVPRRVTDAWATKQVTELTEVTFTDGTTVRCTPNHPFLTLDGTYTRADGLIAGTSVESCYMRPSPSVKCTGYLQHWDRHRERWLYTHREFTRERHNDVSKKWVVHHINFDPCDNRPENLMPMTGDAHRYFHAALNRLNKRYHGADNPRFMRDASFDALVSAAADCKTRVELLTKTGYGSRVFARLLRDASMTYQQFADAYMPAANCAYRSAGYGLALDDVERAARELLAAGKKPDSTNIAARLGVSRQVPYRLCIDAGYRDFKRWRDEAIYGLSREGLSAAIAAHGTARAAFDADYSRFVSFSGFITYVRKHFGGARQLKKSVKTEAAAHVNHVVSSVRTVELSEPEWVYDITVEGSHNFAVMPHGTQMIEGLKNAASELPSSSVFVHNSSKATLAQEDIRFSRTVNTIQRVILSELNKIAAIHLYAHGFDGEDLLDFSLQLSNPSTVAQQQKLELYRAKLEIAASAPEGLVDRYFLRSRVMGMTDDEIRKVETGLERDRKVDAYFEALGGEEGAAADLGGGGVGDLGGAGEEPGTAGGAGDLFASQERSGGRQLLTGDDADQDRADAEADTGTDEPPAKRERGLKGFGPDGAPIKASSDSQLGKRMFNRRRQSTHGPSKTHMPDFVKMTDMMGPQDVDVVDKRALGIGTDPLSVAFDEGIEWEPDEPVTRESARIGGTARSALRSMGKRFARAAAIYPHSPDRSVITEGTPDGGQAYDDDEEEDWIDIDESEFEPAGGGSDEDA